MCMYAFSRFLFPSRASNKRGVGCGLKQNEETRQERKKERTGQQREGKERKGKGEARKGIKKERTTERKKERKNKYINRYTNIYDTNTFKKQLQDQTHE